MTSEYTLKLILKFCFINIGAQKIDGSTFETFRIVLTSFQIENKLERARFLQKTLLLADITVEMVLEMFFLIFSNINI